MSIACPYCQHHSALKSRAAGRFKANCPACGQMFQIVVHADPAVDPVALRLDPATVTSHHPRATAVNAQATVAPPREVAQATASPRARTQAVAPPPPDVPPQPGDLTGSRLGGYELISRLGHGAMGTVYLARQLSLDRNVALKVLAQQLAADPQFVARFTREAYAAAQLNHHNVVQIHDIGVDEDMSEGQTNFFSMELVNGQTLAQVTHDCGKVDPEVAVGYVLQAARGLASAHAHGLIHRDIKPENLLLSEQGVVKVADLGLVKRAGDSDTIVPSRARAAANAAATHHNLAMGTPAYMPPEQAQNAATVDVRADIYSLGCTLYDLLTGRPPFVGRTIAEVMTKHASEAVVPPDRLAHHVPTELSIVVMKMIAKRPVNRYQSMTEVIDALEQWLGIKSGQSFSPRQEHVDQLEAATKKFNSNRWALLRSRLITGLMLISGPLIVLSLVFAGGHLWLPVGVICFAVLSLISYQLIFGITQRTMLVRKVRQLAFDTRPLDWLRLLLLGAVVAFLLIAFGLQYVALAAAILAAGAAFLFLTFIDRPLLAERREPLTQVEAMLRDMRLRGLDEDAVHQFVWKYAGQDWEELYEQLFGYDAKLEARQWEIRRAAGRVGPQGRRRPTHARWRDPLIAAIDRTLSVRQRQRQAKVLARIESRALQAKGLEEAEAHRQAQQNTRRLMRRAEMIRESAADGGATAVTIAPRQTVAPPSRQSRVAATTQSLAATAVPTDWMHDGELENEDHWPRRQHESYMRRRYGTPLDVLLGSSTRFIIAVLILAGFALWWDRNAGQSARNQAAELLAHREDAAATVQKMPRKGAVEAVKVFQNFSAASTSYQPLRVAYVPSWITDAVGSWSGGLAGALLLLSIFFSGRLLALSIFAAAALCLFGARLPWPAATPLPKETAAAALGLAIWVLAVLFLRRTTAD